MFQKASSTFLIRTFLLVLLLSQLAGCQSKALPETSFVGVVTKSIGYPEVIRKNRPYIMAEQSKIYPYDVIQTNKESKLLITMNDGATFILGTDTHLVVHNYTIEEETGILTASLNLTSGSIEAINPTGDRHPKSTVVITTPLARISAHQSGFWCGFDFSANTVDIASLGSNDGEDHNVDVTNQHGTVTLLHRGIGTSVIGASAPQPAKNWSNNKLLQALKATFLPLN